MKCLKCGNLMLSEEFTDYQQTGSYTFIGWGCLSCGLILDPMIMDHRARQKGEERPDWFKEVLAEIGA